MAEQPNEGASNTSRRGKVARLIDSYGLGDLGEELEERWTATGDAHESLRNLAADVNRRILRVAMEAEGIRTVEGEVENLYSLLTEDGVSQAEGTRAVRRLQRAGVDIDSVQRDFVSYQAVRTYLLEERGAEYEPNRDARVDGERRNLEKLVGRVEAVSRSKLERLGRTGQIDLGDFNVLVDVRVICGDCGEQYTVGDLLDSGGCGCSVER